MPTFCRHNRFIERCPICSKTLPGHSQERRGGSASRGSGAQRRSTASGAASRSGARRPRATDVKVYVDGRRRGVDDGYECELVPGLRSSLDARHLAQEIGFAAGRLRALAQQPPGAYALAAELGRCGELDQASWLCFLIAYLCPLDGDEPFVGISMAPSLDQAPIVSDEDVEALPLGPRTCHEPGRGMATLRAYLAWAQRAGSQRSALAGEDSWSPERRFQRVFERLSLPGFPRFGRYELLVILGTLGLYEMSADSLHLAAAVSGRTTGAGKADGGDQVLAAAKRVFGIGDPLLLERRAKQLAEAASVPLAALDLALFNWHVSQRATLGFSDEASDLDATSQTELALGL
ncbi:MAG TPA: hypothetical protein VGP17_11415 [Solirubrobacteraceae bacterium]|nr:hypothetical protein [Solirubrobacteraceae bacterium]